MNVINLKGLGRFPLKSSIEASEIPQCLLDTNRKLTLIISN